MSDVAYTPRIHATRARTLGDAVPTFRTFGDDEPKIVPKTADELRADRDAARDAAPMAASCGVDGCTWAYTGTAGDCRVESATHRANAHPELAGRRTHRKGTNFKRRGEPVDPAVVAESRRLRQEGDDQQRLDTINRGRALRGEQPLEGATSMGTTCKIDGCDEEAPSRGRYARLCVTHRPGSTVSTGATPAPEPEPVPELEPVPEPIVVPPGGDGGSLADLASELEDARADVNRANTRWLDAIRAFKAHPVIEGITEEDVAA